MVLLLARILALMLLFTQLWVSSTGTSSMLFFLASCSMVWMLAMVLVPGPET